MSKRKNHNVLKSEYEALLQKTERLGNQIKQRALELCSAHPDVEIITNVMTSGEMKETSILFHSTEGCLYVIDIIEKHIASLHPHQQQEIKFDN